MSLRKDQLLLYFIHYSVIITLGFKLVTAFAMLVTNMQQKCNLTSTCDCVSCLGSYSFPSTSPITHLTSFRSVHLSVLWSSVVPSLQNKSPSGALIRCFVRLMYSIFTERVRCGVWNHCILRLDFQKHTWQCVLSEMKFMFLNHPINFEKCFSWSEKSWSF